MTTCKICNTLNNVDFPDDWTCSNCEQEYVFDEGSIIHLTTHQWCVLQDDFRVRNSHITETAEHRKT